MLINLPRRNAPTPNRPARFIPEEYHWTTSNPELRESGVAGVQRMTPETWVEVIEREKECGDGHIGPCRGNLPRPKERGECECPVCVENARILAEGPAE